MPGTSSRMFDGAIYSPVMNSCALESQARDENAEARWKQVWQLAVRSISIPSTCRAACVLLHAILQTRLIPHHAIANDVNNIVTMADICGPAALIDSSLVFMHCLASVRNSMVPSASQKTSSFIIRWAFTMWRPGQYSRIPHHLLREGAAH